MVFYRKYRPQNFEQLIGQDHVKKTLLNAFSLGKLGHAYLFVGPRGSGKTSTARILAKLVNCEAQESSRQSLESSEKKETPRLSTLDSSDLKIPCNKCSACISITDGSNMDLIEIDAASNRGIDDIRDLREKIKLSPSSARMKVYIIDEVHMLTPEAFNALLKTLEEPPAHVLFILATTEDRKIPQTILSRVQRFDFNLASGDQIKSVLKDIAEKEKLELNDEILSLISERSEGSFRDAVKNLDQIASSGVKTPEEVRALLKANDFSEIMNLLNLIQQKKSTECLVLINSLSEKGANIKEFTNLVLKTLRSVMLTKNGVVEPIKSELGTAKWEEVKGFADKSEIGQIVSYIENFQAVLEQLKYTTLAVLPLEVAVVKSISKEQPKVEYSRMEDSVLKVEVGRIEKEVYSQPSIPKNPFSIINPPSSKSEPIPSVDDMQSTDDVIVISDKWTYILETIKPYNYSLEALLKQTKVVNCDGSNVILEVPYSFHQRILEAPKSRNLLESILAEVLGKPVKVSTRLGKRLVGIEEVANVEVAADDEIIKIASEIFNS